MFAFTDLQRKKTLPEDLTVFIGTQNDINQKRKRQPPLFISLK